MNRRQIVNKFVEELRNPDNKQCFEKLRDGDKFCALGLLLQVVDPTGWGYDGGDGAVHRFAAENVETIDIFDNATIGKELACKVIQANDEGLTFAQIANIVELADLPAPEQEVDVEQLWRKEEIRRHDAEEDERRDYEPDGCDND